MHGRKLGAEAQAAPAAGAWTRLLLPPPLRRHPHWRAFQPPSRLASAAQAGLPRTSYALWFFQFTFAATSATIVSGAVAERCRFECYVAYNLALVSFVYPCVAHW